MNIEIIWWLETFHHIPMNVIQTIMIDWYLNIPIEDNAKFNECIKLWFDKSKEKHKARNEMIAKYGHISYWNTSHITNMKYESSICI